MDREACCTAPEEAQMTAKLLRGAGAPTKCAEVMHAPDLYASYTVSGALSEELAFWWARVPERYRACQRGC
ncbi:hypothetical protein MRX96_002507 [Rhipicephalus microplus]